MVLSGMVWCGIFLQEAWAAISITGLQRVILIPKSAYIGGSTNVVLSVDQRQRR